MECSVGGPLFPAGPTVTASGPSGPLPPGRWPSRRCNAVTGGQLPEGRYGRRNGRRPAWAIPAGLAFAVLLGLAVAVIGYRNLGTTPIQGQAVSFTLLPGNAVQLRLSVVRDDPSRPAVCIVRARSRDGEETGRREVYVPPAAGPIVLSTVVQTSRPPVTADVYGCSLQVPAYLVPEPHY
ncbi:MAG: DUF4307 domain-containing protein [Pseudonocardiales bacterium]|nr:DUF4307 domain-containing protein [Pseudonocardiales bacterium]